MANSKASYIPKLNNSTAKPRNITFREWWEKQVILTDTYRATYSRKQLVLWVANQYGGAHIDPSIDKEFDDLLSQETTGWRLKSPSGRGGPLDNGVVFPSLRHMAHELIITLSNEFGAFLKEEIKEASP